MSSIGDVASYEGMYLGRALNPENGTDFVEFSPTLNERDSQILQELGERLAKCEHSSERVSLVRSELAHVDGRALRLRASLAILLDLMRHEYCIRLNDGQLEVSATTMDSWRGTQAEYKEFQRRHLLLERDEQLRQASVRRFLDSAESRKRKGTKKNILDLVASGPRVAKQLQEFRADLDSNGHETPDFVEALANYPFEQLPVQPYIQEVSAEAKDEHTNLPLQTIWRYFRHTWTLPYNSTPGRNMQFLVRDAAQPNHPVMGILCLGSSIIQISTRDNKLGWTLESTKSEFRDIIDSQPGADCDARTLREVEHYLATLERALETSRNAINPRGLIQPAAPPTQANIDKLERLLARFTEENSTVTPTRRGTGYRAESLTPLFRKKRAKALLKVVQAQATFSEIAELSPIDRLRFLLTTSAGQSAIGCAIQEQKKVHVGNSMMDLVVCGAIQPYGHILGGKLVAMLATSPTVLLAYRRKYSRAPSEIASAMKGSPVTRPADLVFLGTTSLYETHSSQYERIRLPSALGDIRFSLMGKTEGYSSVQFSRQTRELLAGVTKRRRGRVIVTHKFGEGVNPKLRGIGMGLTDLGLGGRLLKYSSRRLVYGVSLAMNTREYLTGKESTPRYWWAGLDPQRAERAIASFWLGRWAVRRCDRPETAAALLQDSSEKVRASVRPMRWEIPFERGAE